jgi:hypothetical protein
MAKKKGNKNATTSGRFVVGLLPAKLRNIERQVSNFRRMVEEAVIAARGELTILDQANITTAARWERVSQCCTHWLRKSYEEMGHADRLSYSRETAHASAERDKSLKLLRLDKVVADAWEAHYRQPPLVLDVKAVDCERLDLEAEGDAEAAGEAKSAAENAPPDGSI